MDAPWGFSKRRRTRTTCKRPKCDLRDEVTPIGPSSEELATCGRDRSFCANSVSENRSIQTQHVAVTAGICSSIAATICWVHVLLYR